MDAGLYVVGTPIGNLDDFTFRAVETLRGAHVILAEDTRRTRILLQRYEIHTPLISCHRFNEASRVGTVLERVRRGEAVALVTDSGMPGISDPGSRVAAACRAEGAFVTVIPGPCAVSAAVAISGLGGAGYRFEGFLPHKKGQRARRLDALAGENVPVVLFESPYRLIRLLEEIRQCMGERPLFVARELTKRFEEARAGTPTELLAAYSGRTVKGELVVIIAPGPAAPVGPAPVVDSQSGRC